MCRKWQKAFCTHFWCTTQQLCHFWLKRYTSFNRQLGMQMFQNWYKNEPLLAEKDLPLMAEYNVCHYWTKMGHRNCGKFGIWTYLGNEASSYHMKCGWALEDTYNIVFPRITPHSHTHTAHRSNWPWWRTSSHVGRRSSPANAQPGWGAG